MFCNLVAVLSVAICSVSDCWASVARPGSRHLLISAPAPESGQCRRPGPLQSRGARCLASDWSVPGLPGLWLVTGVASVRGNTRQCPPITLGTRRAAQLTECTSHQSRTFSVPSLSTDHSPGSSCVRSITEPLDWTNTCSLLVMLYHLLTFYCNFYLASIWGHVGGENFPPSWHDVPSAGLLRQGLRNNTGHGAQPSPGHGEQGHTDNC